MSQLIQRFLTLALGGDERSASCTGKVYPQWMNERYCDRLMDWDWMPPAVMSVCCVCRLLKVPQLVYKQRETAWSVDTTLKTSWLASIILEMSTNTVSGIYKLQESGAQSQSGVDYQVKAVVMDSGSALHACANTAAALPTSVRKSETVWHRRQQLYPVNQNCDLRSNRH